MVRSTWHRSQKYLIPICLMPSFLATHRNQKSFSKPATNLIFPKSHCSTCHRHQQEKPVMKVAFASPVHVKHLQTIPSLTKHRPRRTITRRPTHTRPYATASSQSESSESPTDSTEETAAPKTPFPKLYDAWFPPHELKSQMQESLTKAFRDGHTLIELQWPTVPNLEEISAGTLLNFEFGKYVASTLGMEAPAEYMLIKRYLAQFCNLYWAIAVAQSEAFRNRTVWAISTDGVSKSAAQNLCNVQLASLRSMPAVGDEDILVMLDPRVNSVWEKGVRMKPKNGATVFLNSQFSESYGLTGPRKGLMKGIETGYFLKRVTRGYAFFAYPGPWRGLLENPDMSIEEVGTWSTVPSLRELAGIVRGESNRRYGGFYNDRYVRGFGGRL